MKTASPVTNNMPLDIVGSSTYGRDPKILSSRTFNMIIADSWLVDFAGYKYILSLATSRNGRGIFTSIPGNRVIAVVGNAVFSIEIFAVSQSLEKFYQVSNPGFIDSFSGDVFIEENNTNQIAICDQHNIYIYNYVKLTFQQAILPEGFIPGFVTYQNGRFIAPDTNSSVWGLSQVGDGLNWFWGASGEPVLGAIQTKPDLAQAAIRVPGRGNLLFVMGKTVTELWTDVGSPTFPYQRSTTMNVDYGCASPATIAASDEMIAWLGINEKSGPTILYSSGNGLNQVSTDGINYQLSKLNYPAKSCGFFLKLSGHLCYQLTFYDPTDNFSLIYDFTTKSFFDVTDENMNYHIARRVAFFDNTYYFVSLNDGNLYELSPELFTFQYATQEYDMPRVRVCKNIRQPNSFRFIANNATVTLEQGNDINNVVGNVNYQPGIALSVSRNGGISFGTFSKKDLNLIGNRINRINWWQIGSANDMVLQFRFWGQGPWRVTNGTVSTYQ
jgi:hypothetical protein